MRTAGSSLSSSDERMSRQHMRSGIRASELKYKHTLNVLATYVSLSAVFRLGIEDRVQKLLDTMPYNGIMYSSTISFLSGSRQSAVRYNGHTTGRRLSADWFEARATVVLEAET